MAEEQSRLEQGDRKRRKASGPMGGLGKAGKKSPKEKEGKLLIKVVGEDGEMLDQPIFVKEFSKGGRAGYKDGSKGCKMATKGKGRAYGKNS